MEAPQEESESGGGRVTGLFPLAPDEGAAKYVIVVTLPKDWDAYQLGPGALLYVDNAKHGGYANGTVAPTVCAPPPAENPSPTVTLLGCLIKDAVIIGISYNKRLALCSVQCAGKFTTVVTDEKDPVVFGMDAARCGVTTHGNRRLRCLQVEATVPLASSDGSVDKIVTVHLK